MHAEPLNPRALSPRVRLVPDGQNGWRAFGVGPIAGLRLSAPETQASLLAGPASDDQIPAFVMQRLIAAGIVAPTESDTLSRRHRWTSVGWGAAFDLLVAMRAEESPGQARVSLPTATAGEPILESLTQGGSTRPLDRVALFEIARTEPTIGAATTLSITVVLVVDGVEPGWYVNSEGVDQTLSMVAVGRELPTEEQLRRIAPVAFGRAGFVVGALVMLFVRCDVLTATAVRYVEAHVAGGVQLGFIEARASERGIPFRCNYAVSTTALAEVHTPPAGYVSVGAVALGAS